MDTVTLITLADESYAMPLAVMVRSLLEHLPPGRAVRVVVIDGGITPGTMQRLNDSWRDSPNWPLCHIDYVAPLYGGARHLPIWGRLTALTYARLSAADYLPAESRRVILMDSDTLVLADIGLLATTDLEGATVAATQDPYIPFVSSVGGLRQYAALGLRPDARYFNAGVMLIDIARWRSERVGQGAFAFIGRHWQSLQQQDQDSLNAVLAGRWKELDPRWQVQPRTVNSLGAPAVDDPYIVHFSGLLKPWLYPGRDRADALFYHFVDRTAWRGVRPRRTLRSWAMALYDSPLRRVFHPIEKRILTGWRRIGRKMVADPTLFACR
jgi:lipopolysaccharide biosynthesis glycosyltransferase